MDSRCVVFLILPEFFSKRGRQALLAYAFVLALSGPAKNTLNNLGILSESLACGQVSFFFLSLSFIILICQMYCVKEQLKQAVKQIIDVIRRPFVAIGEAIRAVVKVLKQIVQKIKEVFLVIKRIVMCIGAGPVGVTFFDTLLISLI